MGKSEVLTLVLISSFALASNAGYVTMRKDMNLFIQSWQLPCSQMEDSVEWDQLESDMIKTAKQCSDNAEVDWQELITGASSLTNATRAKFFTAWCPKMRSAVSCRSPLVAAYRKSCDQRVRVFLETMMGSETQMEIANLICKDDGQLAFDSDGNLLPCVFNTMQLFGECTSYISEINQLVDVSSYGEEQCNELVAFRNCFQSNVNECNPALIELFDVFYRPLVKASPCKTVALS